MILIDTSAWIEFFKARGVIAEQVDHALLKNDAALCGPILTEIHRGLRPKERKRVLPLLKGCHWLEQPEQLWQEAGDLGYFLRRKGASVKTIDLLIATYALAHTIPLLTTDADFTAIRKAGLGLELVPL